MGIAWVLQRRISNNQQKLSVLTWAGSATDIFLVLLTLAWVISSIEEGGRPGRRLGPQLIGG